MLCGFSCFKRFKFPNSALRFINVGVSAHCVPSSTIFISHSAEVAKKQHPIYIPFRRSCENATSKFREVWYPYTRKHINNKQFQDMKYWHKYCNETEWQLKKITSY